MAMRKMNYPRPESIREMLELTVARYVTEWIPCPEKGTFLNLGPGEKHIEGTIELDYPNWDADKSPIPYSCGSVDAIYAIHFLEHVKDPIKMLRECQRVLKTGGTLNLGLPFYNAQIYAQDLTHQHMFCEETWGVLFQNEYYRKDHSGWEFEVGANIIIGLKERNLCLITQLIRR